MTLAVRNPMCTLSRKKIENNKINKKRKGKIKLGKID